MSNNFTDSADAAGPEVTRTSLFRVMSRFEDFFYIMYSLSLYLENLYISFYYPPAR